MSATATVVNCPFCGAPRRGKQISDHFGSFFQWGVHLRTGQTACEDGRLFPRISWDEYFTRIAGVVSLRATCPRAAIGAVIVSRDNRILATGYNGAPPGEPHCIDERGRVHCQIEDGHCQRANHAEVNAIAHAARHGVSLQDARIYISGPRDVCRECRKVLSATGVSIARAREATL